MRNVSSGTRHTCALRDDTTGWCWGDNDYAQLGDGSHTSRGTPAAVSDLTGAVAISAGNVHTCALFADGGYSCWGTNYLGGLGTSGTERVTPPPTTADRFLRISAGAGTTCAVRDDSTVACWGNGFDGQLGIGVSATERSTPADVGGGYLDVDMGDANACAIRSDGSGACWGRGSDGQLGNGMIAAWTPQLVSLPDVAQGVFAAGATVCAIVGAARTLYCWGGNFNGQVGPGGVGVGDAVSSPTLVPGISGVQRGGTGAHTCVVDGAGAVRCWGNNGSGQLGDGTTTGRATPMQVAGITASTVGTGGSFTCTSATVGSKDDVQCVGSDGDGQLGDGGGPDAVAPVTVSSSMNAVLQLAVGASHACDLRDGARVPQCWGRNYQGQVGAGTTGAISPVVSVDTSQSGPFASIVAGQQHTCGASMAGNPYCWGDNGGGQLGTGGPLFSSTRPTSLTIPGTGYAFALGVRHSCASSTTGTYCWGANAYGELGDGTALQRPTPTLVPGIPAGSALAAGGSFTCAATTAGALSCWGDNTHGQLGQGTVSRALVPSEILFQ